jgi:hypothetical protein
MSLLGHSIPHSTNRPPQDRMARASQIQARYDQSSGLDRDPKKDTCSIGGDDEEELRKCGKAGGEQRMDKNRRAEGMDKNRDWDPQPANRQR